MKIIKRLTAIFLAAIAVNFGFSFASATDIVETGVKPALRNIQDAEVSAKTLEGVDRQELLNLLEDRFEHCAEVIDVSHLKINATEENCDALASMVLHIPLAFCVKNLLFRQSEGDTTIGEIEPRYRYEKSVCLAKIAEFKDKASDLTADLVGNNSLTDAEKALLAHDRLALLCEYDFVASQAGSADSPQAYTSYGALIEGKAVCSGYTLAYSYLLRLLDIPCRLCPSKGLNHSWNIVTIGGQDYHVDVTLDDPAWIGTRWNLAGEIKHEFFLLSSAALKERRSDAVVDYDTTPSDTTYDNCYWQNSNTAFQLAGGNLYYIDNVAEVLKCATDDSALCSVQDTWYAGPGSYWRGNYSKLGGDGEKLYFSKKDAIYEIDPVTGTAEVIHTPDLAKDSYRYIYGFAYDEGWLVYDVNNSPNFNEPTMERLRVLPDKAEGLFQISVTNNADSKQDVSITAAENFPIRGFYWGTSENMVENEFYEWQEQAVSANLTVTQPDRYYLAVLGMDENLLETQILTFYETALDANGGSVAVESVLTLGGNTLSLPVPEKPSYVFEGWFTEQVGGANAKGMTASESLTLYARYRMIGDINSDGIVNNIDASQILQYSCGLIRQGDEWMLFLGDLNDDGMADNLDAIFILQFDAGVISAL